MSWPDIRPRIPRPKLIPQSFDELETKIRELYRDPGSDMLTIELVDPVATHFDRSDDSLLHESAKALSDSNLRAPYR